MQTGKEAGEAQMQVLGEDWQIIESLLPAGWMEMARELGALRRTRGFADARALLRVMLISQIANGVLLPFVLIFMLQLVNKPELMGEDRNGPWTNAIAISTSVVMIGLTVVLIWNSIRV